VEEGVELVGDPLRQRRYGFEALRRPRLFLEEATLLGGPALLGEVVHREERPARVQLVRHPRHPYLEGLAAPTEEPQPIKLVLAKQRNGPTGEADLVFLKKYTRFESLARDA
jgi:hypothetical protein